MCAPACVHVCVCACTHACPDMIVVMTNSEINVGCHLPPFPIKTINDFRS